MEEGLALYRYAADCAGGDIVEIGSFRGKSSVALARGAADLPITVYCIEPHVEFTGVYGGRFGPQDRGAFYQVMLQTGLFAKVALINLSSREAARGWMRPIGLLFIDGDHTYRGVEADYREWERHVCLGGVIAFDDATDPAIGPAKLIGEILTAGRYAALETVGKMRFFRKIACGPASHGAKRRILVACHDLSLAGGLLRFERFGRVAAARGHEVAFLRLCAAEAAARSCEFPCLNLSQAALTQWDVTIAPGAGFPPETIEKFADLAQPAFGLRMQHVLNDQTRKSAFLQLNEKFKPHLVVFNNQSWPPGSYTLMQAARFHVLEGGVDLSAFFPIRRSENEARKSRFVIGGLAGKNPLPLIEAVRGLGEGFELQLFGPAVDLDNGAQNLLRTGALKLIGPLSEKDLPAFYAELDCVVHTELFAGWANLAAEALASGVPLVCTTHGTRAFAKHGQTALLLSEPSAQEIASSIRLLRSNEGLRNQLSKNGRQVIGQFSWETYATRLLALMDDPNPSVHYTWAPELGLFGKWPKEARLQGLDALLNDCKGKNILDLGAADGLIAREFLISGASALYGVDRDTARVAGARALCSRFPAAQFWSVDLGEWQDFLDTLKLKPKLDFDIVLCLGIYQHLPGNRRIACLLGAAELASDHLVVRMPEHLFKEDGISNRLATVGFELEFTSYDSLQMEMGPLHCYRRSDR